MGGKKLTKEEMARQLPKRYYESSLRSAVDRETIIKIVPRLHKINLSGYYKYPEINEKLGPLYDDTKNNWMKKKSKHNKNSGDKNEDELIYKKKYIRRVPNFVISVFVNPTKGYYRKCHIQVTPRKDIESRTYKDFLRFLEHSLPNLQTSKVEYALDCFCTDVITLENFTDIVRRHLYVPHQRKVTTLGGDAVKIGENAKNLLIHFGDEHKAYERGKDCDKTADGDWEIADIDRLRFEFTAGKGFLKKHGIYHLRELIEDPKFFGINVNRWKFKRFKKSSKELPSPWEPFTAEDEEGFTGSFQMEHIKATKDKIVKNLAQAREDVPEFFKTQYYMAIAMRDFDEHWRSIICDESIYNSQ